MRRDEFEVFLENEIFPKLRSVRADGQKEYAHSEENAFRNFESVAEDIAVSREKALWILYKKHHDGIKAHLNGHTSQREPVQGRIKDAIMYLCLLWAMIEEGSGGFPFKMEWKNAPPTKDGELSDYATQELIKRCIGCGATFQEHGASSRACPGQLGSFRTS